MKIFLTILVIIFWVNLSYSEEKKGGTNSYHSFSEKCMGTKFTLLMDEPNFKMAKKTAKEAFQEAHRLNNIFSDYLSDSELSKLSKLSGSGSFIPLSDDLFEVIQCSQKLYMETNGKFDITIGPLSRLWRIARFRGILPAKQKLLMARQKTGFKNIILNRKKKTVKLLKSGMILDLGGIAKGYAADHMFKVCKSHNISRVLIDAGGDLLLGDPPIGKEGWRIEIGGRKHPELPTLTLSNVAVATSGDIEQKIKINNKTYSHIIDPDTGLGLTKMSQVTIIAPTAIEADSLASTFLLLGNKEGGRFLKTKDSASAFYLEQNAENIILSKIK